MRQVLCQVLVGRGEETARLQAALAAAQAGRLSELLASPGGEVITYCTIGGRASTAWFALEYLLGREHVRVYDGSWAEWGRMARTPVE